MAMRSATSSRRVYPRAGSLVLCLSGLYFGPRASTKTSIDPDREVTHRVLRATGRFKRIEVTQASLSDDPPVIEVWTTKELVFQKRAPKAAEASPEAAPAAG